MTYLINFQESVKKAEELAANYQEVYKIVVSLIIIS